MLYVSSPSMPNKGLLLISSMLQDCLQEWVQHQQTFLDELLCHDSHGNFLGESTCFVCAQEEGVYKCEDCTHGVLLNCQGCTISLHNSQLLH